MMLRYFSMFVLGLLCAGAAYAETHDTCSGFVTAVPATITTQGVWCMKQDLSTNVTSGAAITIGANNVTIDCNGFKLGGLAAGPGSLARGIQAQDRLNNTIRNCAIRGFHTGIQVLGSGGGHLVEDNRIDQSLKGGIRVSGDNNLVQRNRIYDTGGTPDGSGGFGIDAEGDVIENTISGVFGIGTDASVLGLYVAGVGSEVRGNRVRNLSPNGNGTATGIITGGGQMTMAGNRVINVGVNLPTPGVAIIASGDSTAFCVDNTVAGFASGIVMCDDLGGNGVH